MPKRRERPPRVLAATAVTLAFLVAGCTGSGGGADADLPDPGTGDPISADAAEAATILRFEGAQPMHHVLWANGTVEPHQTCNTGGCLMGYDGVIRVTDLTPHLRDGVPALLAIELTWNPGAIMFGGFDAFLDAPESTVYQGRATFEPGRLAAQAVLRPSGSVAVVMAPYGPGGDVPSTAYTLRIQMDIDPVALLPSVPVAIAMEGGDTLRANSYGGGDADFLLYAPDDRLLGQFDGEHRLPDGAPAGDYVAVLPVGGPTGNLTVDSGAVAMRALGLRYVMGPDTEVPPTGAVEVPWQVDASPVGVGGLVKIRDDLPVAMMASTGLSLRVAGPGGFELDAGVVCGLCITGGFGYTASSGTGDPRVVPGQYTLHAASDGSSGARVQPFTIHLDR